MTEDDLAVRYRDYLACLNARDWPQLGRYVDEDVVHNGRQLGLSGYRAMIGADVRDIPDLRYEAEWLAVQPPRLAARFAFDCRPVAAFLGLDVNRRRIRFAEHAFYLFREGRIAQVWSVLDKAAVEAQLR